MKVLITQRGKREVYVERERLQNGQTFFSIFTAFVEVQRKGEQKGGN